tara:strand:- start:981 stop:2075 length:1095 start_codon:yes stop_codon:yes gene_type:complete
LFDLTSFGESMKHTVDFLIIGQGIAGTILSYQLINKGFKVLVIDDQHQTSSTLVAAGLINPLVLKRLTKTWRAEEFIEFNDVFYSKLENDIKSTFVIDKKIIKLISSDDEREFWKKRSKVDGVCEFITDQLEDLSIYPFFHKNRFEGGLVKKTGWVDTRILLDSYRNYLINKANLITETVDYDNLKVTDSDISYKNIIAKQVIFCDGFKSCKNHFFSWVPLSLVKGELLTIESDELSDDYIFNKKIFILPIGNQQYKVGATYDWRDLSLLPTEIKKKELLKNLDELIDCNYTVIDHIAGIRPAVKDRRPLTGTHPVLKNIHLFNGMGSRGLFMAPKLGSEFVDYLTDNKNLNAEVDLKRYYSEF